MRANTAALGAVIVLMVATSAGLHAQTPMGSAFTYQGQLKESGTPVTGAVDFRFSLWDAATGGSQLGYSYITPSPVDVVDGLFTIPIDSANFGPNGFNGDARWLRVDVYDGSWVELTPRQPMTPVPYALYAAASGGGTCLWDQNGSDVYYSAGDVGIGTSTPHYPLHAVSVGGDTAVAGENPGESTSGYLGHEYAGVYGQGPCAGYFVGRTYFSGNVGIGTGSPSAPLHVTGDGARTLRVRNTAATGGTAILAEATSGTGYPYAIDAYVAAPAGYGVYAFNEAESGNAYAIYGENISPDGIAIYGLAGNSEQNSTGIGVYGRSESVNGGAGVYGETTAMNGTTYGVRGVSATGTGVRGDHQGSGHYGALGTADAGVYGRAADGRGVRGESSSPNHGVGVSGEWDGDSGLGSGGYFVTDSPGNLSAGVIGRNDGGGVGVRGWSIGSSGGGYGVWGQSTADDGRGVYGEVTHTTGTNYGVYGESASEDGYGVYGTNTHTDSDAPAVYGEHDVTDGRGLGVKGVGGRTGVYGLVSSGGGGLQLGVRAMAASVAGINVGVWGEAINGDINYAGRFWGDVECTGTLSKGGGSFKIDHPLDPENKYLYHSFVESPDMMNVYNGNVTTDVRGYATVKLPEWFEALNKDFRYQLTVIGEFAQAIVAEEIRDNRFVIRSDKPNVKVSWQVTGIRQDEWAEAHRIPVEEDKPEDERGYYIHPELFGKTVEESIMWPNLPPREQEERRKHIAAHVEH